ncbi:hypothetical protein L2E82_10757 [Cichorium intybus]|uniref:Uncharacterized protein n=1 Tax=Cichorium intybus TaxID=13427 RepID=A0ACB9GBJ9_CICIN|nr:hypothetical protein L2E82_10757 [Cichorium intybus]
MSGTVTTLINGYTSMAWITSQQKVEESSTEWGKNGGIALAKPTQKNLGNSGSFDQVSDVNVRGAILSNTENGVRIKTWQGGTGFVKNVKFEDVWMENVLNSIIIDQYYCDSNKKCLNKVMFLFPKEFDQQIGDPVLMKRHQYETILPTFIFIVTYDLFEGFLCKQ